MRRTVILVAALLGLGACGERRVLPDLEIDVEVTVGARQVAVGEGFPVTVRRLWSRELDPAPFEEDALAPLVLRHEATTRREDARRVEETRRYRAHVFALDDVVVPALVFTARPPDGGTPRRARTERTRLRVVPRLDPVRPGDPELPGALPPLPFPWARVAVGSALALALLGLVLVVRRRRARQPARPAEPPPGPTPPPPHEPFLAALVALRARAGDTGAGRRAAAVETAEILRRYVGAAWPVRAAEKTTPEILADAALQVRVDASDRAALGDLLARCDRVKFAAVTPTAQEAADLVDGAERFVRRTAEGVA